MSISLNTYANGDTDYITKMNADNSALTSAINALQSAQQASSGVSAGLFLVGMFGTTPTVIGRSSYNATISGVHLNLTAGYAWKPSTNAVVHGSASASLDFTGKAAGTYYIPVDAAGVPSIASTNTDALYSVAWDGVATLSSLTRLAVVMPNASDLTTLLSL